MTDQLKLLHQALASLSSTVESEDAESVLLEALHLLCKADLLLLLQPLTPQHWQATTRLPASAVSTSISPVDMFLSENVTGNSKRLAVEQVLQFRTSLRRDNPILSGEFDDAHLRRVELEQGRFVFSSLMLPLADRSGRVEKVIELLRLDGDPDSVGFSEEDQLIAGILTQQAVAGQTRLISRREQSDLFESLIQLIGSAIDEKSPYAGDHCRRVPVLTMLLGRAVSASHLPAFRKIHFNDSDLYELEVAAWLHDIGKLITPIHITDKASKLERTFDRFDLVRARFEILRRDLELARLRAGETSVDVEIPGERWDPQQMLDDLRFLADCNRGRNQLGEAETSRVTAIAEHYRWIDRQGEVMPVLTDDEAANLKVVRGTLTDEERELINHHVVSTINMLDMLPFPPELERVPEIAGAHHESFNGQGFPTGQDGSQMLIQARILGFADLFESISSGSRPYKKRNSLSQSLQILREMVDTGQVDPDLYRLFIEEKLYESFAIEFLARDQIDPVDRAPLLRGLALK